MVHTLRGDPQGGSTITQQLARNLFPEEIGRSRTITRKLKEAITAFKIEWTYSRDEILETYLNTVPFLYNAYGIEMAARTYFDKSADKLNLLESATLIGMLKGTAYYNPVTQPERSAGAAQHRAGANGQARQAGGVQAGGPAKRPLRIDFERQTEAMGLVRTLRSNCASSSSPGPMPMATACIADGPPSCASTIDSRQEAMANQAVALAGCQLQGIADNAWSAPQRLETLRANWRARRAKPRQYREAVAKGEPADEVPKSPAGRHPLHDRAEAGNSAQAGFMAMDSCHRAMCLSGWAAATLRPTCSTDVQAARRQPGPPSPFVYGLAHARGAAV